MDTPEFIAVGFVIFNVGATLYMFATRRRTRTQNIRMRAALKTAVQIGRI
jgi:hypothetical protein